MPFHDHPRPEPSAITRVLTPNLQEILDRAKARLKTTIKEKLCAKLQEAYDAEPVCNTYFDWDIDIPGRDRPQSNDPDVGDYMQPGDQEDDMSGGITVIHELNQRKIDLLNEALRWGCPWAETIASRFA
ncbi:MAG: hypothetical protein V3T53_13260 [Phycisphaerales bacterium]